MSRQNTEKKLKLIRQRNMRPFAYEDPNVPVKSRKVHFNKPDAEMLRLARAAVDAGKVKRVAPSARPQVKTDEERAVLAEWWGYRGFSV